MTATKPKPAVEWGADDRWRGSLLPIGLNPLTDGTIFFVDRVCDQARKALGAAAKARFPHRTKTRRQALRVLRGHFSSPSQVVDVGPRRRFSSIVDDIRFCRSVSSKATGNHLVNVSAWRFGLVTSVVGRNVEWRLARWSDIPTLIAYVDQKPVAMVACLRKLDK